MIPRSVFKEMLFKKKKNTSLGVADRLGEQVFSPFEWVYARETTNVFQMKRINYNLYCLENNIIQINKKHNNKFL